MKLGAVCICFHRLPEAVICVQGVSFHKLNWFKKQSNSLVGVPDRDSGFKNDENGCALDNNH